MIRADEPFADFNVIMWDVGKLDLCQKYGIKLMVEHGPEGWDPPGNSRSIDLVTPEKVIEIEAPPFEKCHSINKARIRLFN